MENIFPQEKIKESENFFCRNLEFLRKSNKFKTNYIGYVLDLSPFATLHLEKVETITIGRLTQLSKLYDISIDDLINKDLSINQINQNEETTQEISTPKNNEALGGDKNKD